MTVELSTFKFSDRDFRQIRDLIKQKTGIHLSEHKSQMVYSRLTKRLRHFGLNSFSDYLRLVRDDKVELTEFVNALTTNLTHFFREPHHFDFLRDTALPEAMARRGSGQAIKIWSAACSVGMEPYSILITLAEALSSADFARVELYATDLDSNVLDKAKAGVYDQAAVSKLPANQLKRFFRRGTGRNAGLVRVNQELREKVRYEQLNFFDSWAAELPSDFDVVFCRNVLIYFTSEDQARVVKKIAERMVSGGYLFLGHSESLFRKSDDFEFLGKTTYRRGGAH